MGVAVDYNGKKRLVVDARYINLFDPYHTFSYEKLADVPQYLQQNDYFMLTDMKAGYHQVPMHPDTSRFLGIEFEGQVYVFKHLPFGLSSACRAYTDLMAEVHRPLRRLGLRMTSFIDDVLYAFPSKQIAKAEGIVVLKILSALGFFFSVPKCHLLAEQTGKFLGLLVDAANSSFAIPPDKLARIQHLIQALKTHLLPQK